MSLTTQELFFFTTMRSVEKVSERDTASEFHPRGVPPLPPAHLAECHTQLLYPRCRLMLLETPLLGLLITYLYR